MSVCTFYSIAVLNFYRIAMVTGQVDEVMSPKSFSHVTKNSGSLCPKKKLLKRSYLHIFLLLFSNNVMKTLSDEDSKPMFISNNKVEHCMFF